MPDLIIFLSALYHLLAGGFAIGPKKWMASFLKNTYQLKVPEVYEPRYEITVRFLGLMALALSAHLFLIYFYGTYQLKLYSLIILGILFISRAISRVLFKKIITDAYQLNFKRSLINIIFNTIIALFSFISIYYLHE